MLGIFLDTETNGLDPSIHTILEISFIIINLINGKKVLSYEAMIIPTEKLWKNSNSSSLSYTQITLNSLKKKGKKKTIVKKEILDIFLKCNIQRNKAVFICQNPSFDRSFFGKLIEVSIQEDFHFPYYWLDLASMFWCKQVSKDIYNGFSLSKDAIAKHYGLKGEKKPHRAKQGVLHLIDCYDKVVGFPKKDFLKDV